MCFLKGTYMPDEFMTNRKLLYELLNLVVLVVRNKQLDGIREITKLDVSHRTFNIKEVNNEYSRKHPKTNKR